MKREKIFHDYECKDIKNDTCNQCGYVSTKKLFTDLIKSFFDSKIETTQEKYFESYRTSARVPDFDRIAPKTSWPKLVWAWCRGINTKIKIRNIRINFYPKIINYPMDYDYGYSLSQVWSWHDRQSAAKLALQGKNYQMRGETFAPYNPHSHINPTNQEVKWFVDNLLPKYLKK